MLMLEIQSTSQTEGPKIEKNIVNQKKELKKLSECGSKRQKGLKVELRS